MKFVPNSITRSLNRKVLVAKKNSPHIFFAGGIVGFVGTTVLACRATLKVEEPLNELRGDIEAVKELYPKEGRDVNSDFEKEYYKDLGYVYGKGVLGITKLYAPSIILGVASIGALTGSHVQLTRRNSALTATLAAVTKAYDEYRDRVREAVGEERELEIYRGAHEEERDGKLVQVVKDPSEWSIYARIFDETSTRWEKSAEMNRLLLKCQQDYANNILIARGHLFLNEVYDMLGFEHTSAGAIVGWVYGGDGDNYVDFGIFDAYNSRFVNNLERSIILDFNVDGPIWDKI